MPNGYSGICLKFQSTPPARGATKKKYNDMLSEDISIHAPREGGDMDDASIYPEEVVISIHAPREGGDPRLNTFHHLLHLFQSTPPARGATWR